MVKRASGIDVEHTVRDQALWDILKRMHKCKLTMESIKENRNGRKSTSR